METATRTALRLKAATALDETHYTAFVKRGIYTDQARGILAQWLDGKPARVSYIRKLVKYLFSMAHPYDGRSRGPSYYRDWS
jgi:hypothetical protein